jgi:pyrroline-5-carboxylate reductase
MSGVRAGAISGMSETSAPARAAVSLASVRVMPDLLVIVGGGNMGAALLGGLLAADGADPDAFAVTEALPTRRDELHAAFPGVAVTAEVPACRAAVIAVKPVDVAGAVGQVVAAGARRILSIAAGVSIAALETAAGRDVAVIRAMPNTPALVGAGASAIAAGTAATADDLDWAAAILCAVGTVARVDEKHLDAVTALTGSGPAYLFLVAEALIDAGVAAGLARPLAEALTTQLFVGSSALLQARGDPAALRAMVTSPAGTTAAGLQALEARAVRAAFADAVRAAAARSAELGA